MMKATALVSKISLPTKVVSRPIATKATKATMVSRPTVIAPRVSRTVGFSFNQSITKRTFNEEVQGERGQRGFNRQRRDRPPREERPLPEATSVWLRTGVRRDEDNLDAALQGYQLGPSGVVRTASKYGIIFVEFASLEEATRALRDRETTIFRNTTPEAKDQVLKEAQGPSNVLGLRRVPFSATKRDIKDLFPKYNLSEDDITVGHGSAYVKFKDVKECEEAMSTTVGHERFSRAFLVPGLLCQFTELEQNQPTIVKVRGAPSGVRLSDFREFFTGLNVLRINIVWQTAADGTQTPSNIFVEFGDADQARRSLEKNGQYIGERFLRIFTSSANERRQALQRQRLQQQQQQEAGSEQQ